MNNHKKAGPVKKWILPETEPEIFEIFFFQDSFNLLKVTAVKTFKCNNTHAND